MKAEMTVERRALSLGFQTALMKVES